jgi:hypothetical protein
VAEDLVTLDEAKELRAGDQLIGEDGESRVVLDLLYNNPYPNSKFRLPVLNLETGRRESWPDSRFDELERVT